MTPIINPWVFYLSNVVSNLDVICFIGMIFGGSGVVLFAIMYLMGLDGCFEDDVTEAVKKLLKVAIITLAVSSLITIFIPSETTITKMLVAQNVTYERVETVTDTVETVYNDIMELFENGEA